MTTALTTSGRDKGALRAVRCLRQKVRNITHFVALSWIGAFDLDQPCTDMRSNRQPSACMQSRPSCAALFGGQCSAVGRREAGAGELQSGEGGARVGGDGRGGGPCLVDDWVMKTGIRFHKKKTSELLNSPHIRRRQTASKRRKPNVQKVSRREQSN